MGQAPLEPRLPTPRHDSDPLPPRADLRARPTRSYEERPAAREFNFGERMQHLLQQRSVSSCPLRPGEGGSREALAPAGGDPSSAVSTACSTSSLRDLDGTLFTHGRARALHRHHKSKLANHYVMDHALGTGRGGTVFKVKHRETGQTRAMKILPLRGTREYAMSELSILKRLDHPNVCRVIESFEDAKVVYLVLELFSGGELYDRIVQAVSFSEDKAAAVIDQIAGALSYCHDRQVIHRDIKPENIVYETQDEHSGVKLIDFGFAVEFTGGVRHGRMTANHRDMQLVGTPYYVAPEVAKGAQHTPAVDLWAVGVVLFVLLGGYPPFFGETTSETLEKVKAAEVEFPDCWWGHVSADAKDLLLRLLRAEPLERCTAAQALQHPWLVRMRRPSAGLNLQLVTRARFFCSQNKLKKAAYAAIAHQIPSNELEHLRYVFASLDTRKRGTLSLDDVQGGIRACGVHLNEDELREVFVGLDTDGSRQVDWSEFVTACCAEEYAKRREYAWAAFRLFDQRKRGAIAPRDLEEVLGAAEVRDPAGVQVVEDIVREVAGQEAPEVPWPAFQAMLATDVRPERYRVPKTPLAAVCEEEFEVDADEEHEVDADDPLPPRYVR